MRKNAVAHEKKSYEVLNCEMYFKKLLKVLPKNYNIGRNKASYKKKVKLLLKSKFFHTG